MSYKKPSDNKTDDYYDFMDFNGPTTFKQMDAVFKEYCRDYSNKTKGSSAVTKPLTLSKTLSNSSFHQFPSLKSLDLASPLIDRNDVIVQRSPEDNFIMKLLSFSNRSQVSSSQIPDDEVYQTAVEYGINFAVLASMQNTDEKRRYIVDCMKKKINDDLRDFNKKRSGKLNQIVNAQNEYQKQKNETHGDNTDIFAWLNVKTPHEPLKKKLRSRLAETINDYDNQSKIEASLEDIKKSKNHSYFSASPKKIQLDNVPIVDNLEILQGILGAKGDLKVTKGMKHAQRKKEDEKNEKLTKNLMAVSSTHLQKNIQEALFNEAEKELGDHSEESRDWDNRKERAFKYYREDAKSRLFNKIKSCSWNEMGASPMIQASQKKDKNKQQRETKLANYINGDLLTPEEYKLIANTSVTLNRFVDKKYMQTVVNNLDPEILEAFEIDLAEKTIKDYQNRQHDVQDQRLKYLKEKKQEIVAKIENREVQAMRKAKVMEGRNEQTKIKDKAVSLLTKIEERKLWKKKRDPTKKESQTPLFDGHVDVGHFADKFLNVVNEKLQNRKFREKQEFLKRLLPFRKEESLIDVNLSRHNYHPSSKILITSDNPAKDYLGLGTTNISSALQRRKNEPVRDFKLTIHSPSVLTVGKNFRKFYSGGPEDEDNIFQGLFVVGDVSKYKVDKLKEQVVLKIQAAWRGYKQRQFFRAASEMAHEKVRNLNRKDFLMKNSQSKFVKTVLRANEKKKFKEKGRSSPGLESPDQKEPALRSLRSRNLNEEVHGPESLKRKTSNSLLPKSQIDLEREIMKSVHNGDRNLTNESSQVLKTVESTKSHRVLVRPQTASAFMKSTTSPNKLSQNNPNISNNSPHAFNNDDERTQKIVQRAAPKGLLLKQRKLFTAAKRNNFDLILNSGFSYYEADVNVKDEKNNSVLYYAAKKGNKEICEFLCQHKAYVNEPCSDGNTPLHMAFASNQIMVIILLISYGGNLNVLNKYGQTPIAFGSESTLALLDLKNAVATYNQNAAGKSLPQDHDNNRYLHRLKQNNNPDQDFLSFNYAPLKKNLGKVDPAGKSAQNYIS